MDFSGKLQKLRKSGGYSQEELANELNVSRQAISKWELGTIPDINNLIAISKFFDCSLDYLLNDAYEEPTVKKDEEPMTVKKHINVGVLLSIIGIVLSLVAFTTIYIISVVLDIRLDYVIGGKNMYYMGICALIEKYKLVPVIVLESAIFLWSYIWLSLHVTKKKGLNDKRKRFFFIGVIMMSALVIVSVYELVVGPYIFLDTFISIVISIYTFCAIVLSFNLLGEKK